MPDKEILRGLADNPALMQAVKQLLYKHLEVDTLKESIDGKSNEELGQVLRARLEGLKAVEAAFKEIAIYKSPPQIQEKINPGR